MSQEEDAMRPHVLLLLSLSFLQSSCSAVAMFWPMVTVRHPITHVVVCWLKEPGNDRRRNELIAASESFREIPGVIEVVAGPPLPSTRPAVDSTFDVAVVIRFRDQKALDDYEGHWRH